MPPRRRPARLPALATVLLVALALGDAALAAGKVLVIQEETSSGAGPGEMPLLLGIQVGRDDRGTLEVYRDDSLLFLPVDQIAEMLGMVAQPVPEGVRFLTPLGDVLLRSEELREIRGIRCVERAVLASLLSAEITFDEQEFALMVSPPWGGRRLVITPYVMLEPDARPPASGVSTFRLDSRAAWDRETGWEGQSEAIVTGRLARGRWRIRTSVDDDGDARASEYAWLRRYGRTLVLAGQENPNIYPLFRGLELTGGQVAWTDRPEELLQVDPEPRELIPRSLRSTSSFRGRGPVGGQAALRIDGVIVDRRVIGLDGSYEFIDVPISSRQMVQVEILVFDRGNPEVPIEIRSEHMTSSDFLLPGGSTVLQGAAGRLGNLLQESLDDEVGEHSAGGAAQWRTGVSDRLTLEVAAQHDDVGDQAMVGAVGRLGKAFVGSLGLAWSDDRLGYDLSLEGYGQRWRLISSSQRREAGFDPGSTVDTESHFGELGVFFGDGQDLYVAAVGRRRVDDAGATEYLLPGVRWRPFPHTYVSAFPDLEGDYVADASYGFMDGSRLSVAVRDQTTVEYRRRLDSQSQLAFGSRFGGGIEETYYARYSYSGRGPWRYSLNGGVVVGDGEVGGELGAQAPILPGLLLQADVASDPLLTAAAGKRDWRATIGLVADLGFSGGKVLAAETGSTRANRGAVAGQIEVLDAKGERYDLSGLTIRLNGRGWGETGRGGAFYLRRIPPGTYVVTLDAEGLPLELVPVDSSVVAEVADGATTRVDFSVRPEYGAAGSVRDAAGSGISDVPVVVEGADGEVVSRDRTDRWGLFRLDGLPPGRYLVRTDPGWTGGSPASREITVTDDFLFDVDLVVETDPAPMPVP